MARNFSESPKDYKKLRCYSKNDNPFYIRHDTFITNSDIEVTENSSENSEQSLKIQESTKIAKTSNVTEKENKFEFKRESEFAESNDISEKNEKHKQEQPENHDTEEIIWETKTIRHEENLFRSKEKTESDDSEEEEEEEEAIEKSFLFFQKKEKYLDNEGKIEQDDVEGAIWEIEITTNTEYKSDQSNTQLEVEDLEQIEGEGNNSDRQEQLEQQFIEGILWETKITTHRESQFESEGENETENTLNKLKSADVEQVPLIAKKEKYDAERQDQCETEETNRMDLPVTEFEAEDLGQIEESFSLSHFKENHEDKQYQLKQQDINSSILETETTIHTDNTFDPEKTNKTDSVSVTKMEVKDKKLIEERLLVEQTEESCPDKQESFEWQDTEDIKWETEVTTNSVRFESGLEIEKYQNNEFNSKVFEFSSVLDNDHDSDEYQDIEEEEAEEYKSMSFLTIEGSKSKTLLSEASDGVNQEIEKLVGETTFGCLLEIDKDTGENSPTDNLESDLKGKFRLQGILDIEKINFISEWEDESVSSDDEGFHELSLCINVGDEETKAKPVITNLLETICGDIGSLAHFDLSNIDEDKMKQNKAKAKANLIHNKESKFKFNCTVELETNSEEEQECKQKEDGIELISSKEDCSQLEETNVQQKPEVDGNIPPLKHLDEPDKLQKDHADTKENAKDTDESLSAEEDIFDISDNEELLLFEQLFEQLSSCPENEISRKEQTKGCIFSGRKGKQVSEKSFEPQIISNIETQEDIIPCIKDTQISLEGFNTASFSSSRMSLQLPNIIASDNFEKTKYVPFIEDQVVHQDIKTAEDQYVLIIDKSQNEKEGVDHSLEEANTENKEPSTSDIFTETQSSSEWMLEVDKSDKAKRRRKAFIEEIAYKVAESKKRTEDIFTHIEALALWKLESDIRAKAKKERKAFIEEIAYKVTQSQMRIDQMFTEIETFAILKLDIVRKEKENTKREIEMSPAETQYSTIERRKEDEEKETTISQITESAANLKTNEFSMKIKEKETDLVDQETRAVENENNEEICFIFKEKAEKLQNQLFPGSNKKTETTEKCHENKEIFDKTRLEEDKGGNNIFLVKGKDDAEENGNIQTNDTQQYHPGNNYALGDISTQQDQKEISLDQQVTCLLPILSMLWFICLLLKLFQDEIKLQQEQEKKSADYKYFDILEWP